LNRFVQQTLGRCVDVSEHHPAALLWIIAIVTLLTGVYVWRHFAIDSDLGKLIRPSDETGWYQANESFKAAFPQLQQTSIVVVSGTRLEAVDDTAHRLADRLRSSGRFEFVFAPALDPFLRDHRAYFLDLADLDRWISGVQYDYGAILRLADGADLINAAFTLADQVAATDGLRLPSALESITEQFTEGVPTELTVRAYPHLEPDVAVHYVIIMLKGQQALNESLPNAAQVALIRSIVDATAVDPGVRVRLTGEVPLSHEEISAALSGIGIAGAVSLILLAVILRIGVRSYRVIGSIFVLLGVGVVLTLGFGVATAGSFNTLSLIFVVMFFGLGVDFAVHFSLRLWESADPSSDVEVHAAHEIGPALLLCMLTSCVAFLSFWPTEYRGLAELGIISAGGMAIALVLTLTLIPALFAVVGLPEPLPGWRGIRLNVRPRTVLLATGCVGLVALWFAKDVAFDYSVLALRDERTEAMSTLLELQDNGVTTDYSINVLAADGAAARRLKANLTRLPEVGEVLIPSDLVPDRQAEKRDRLAELASLVGTIGAVNGSDWEDPPEALDLAIESLAEVRGEVPQADQARYQAFEQGMTGLRQAPGRLARLGDDLRSSLAADVASLGSIVDAQPFSIDELPADLLRRLIAPDGRHLVTVLPSERIDTRAATDAFVGAVRSVTPEVAGRAVVEWGVGSVAVRSFVEAVVLAIGMIAALLVVYFRSIRLSVLVLTPLALTSVLTFALIHLTPLTLNMADILVIPLIFGLGVDSGIHVVHRFSATGDVSSVMSSSTARAVLISALTTIGTFFSLSFSPHKGAASVGMLLTVAISVMLVATFVVLPALLRTFGGATRQSRVNPVS
jgi:hopanoid biosynthesis associated RND transporter like protein HpnN